MNIIKLTTLVTYLLIGAPLALGQSTDETGYSDLPASWETSSGVGHSRRRIKKKKKREWWMPQFAIGAGLNVPEFVPIESYLFFGKYFAIRGFYTPPLPFNIRVEMPSDVISTQNGVGVANPDFEIRFKMRYGPHYGFEGLFFPTGKSFFIGGGASFRQVELDGEAKSPVYVCSLVEAYKEPPCGDPSARLQTETEIDIKAQAVSAAHLARASTGWMWDVGRTGYTTLYAGYSRPFRVKSNVNVQVDLDSPGSSDEELSGALGALREEKEQDLRGKALKEIEPSTAKGIPIVGFSLGVRF